MNTEQLKTKCLAETLKHIKRVGYFINLAIQELSDRAQNHDNSKLEEPELTGFAINTDKLSKVEYGSDEYKQMLEDLKPTIEHHYANNRHHTEHWPDGINDMNLIDILEMLCDWRAAGERNKNGNIKKSIEVNAAKYRIDFQLKQILENTARDLFN